MGIPDKTTLWLDFYSEPLGVIRLKILQVRHVNWSGATTGGPLLDEKTQGCPFFPAILWQVSMGLPPEFHFNVW